MDQNKQATPEKNAQAEKTAQDSKSGSQNTLNKDTQQSQEKHAEKTAN